MRRFRDIIEDIKEPNPQSLWLDKGKLKFFGTKGWASMVGEDAGTPEDFTFTIEDGTKVTKSIRVISTTTTQNVVNNNGGEDVE